jgi:hypothetical protein
MGNFRLIFAGAMDLKIGLDVRRQGSAIVGDEICLVDLRFHVSRLFEQCSRLATICG